MRWILFALLVSLGGACDSNGSKPPETKTPPPKPAAAEVKGGAPGSRTGAPAGPRVEGQGFVVEVQAPVGAEVGATAAAQVVLKPTGGYHVNKEFPTALEVTPPSGVEVEKVKQGVGDAARFEETGGEFIVKFTAKDAGAKKFTATFRFAVCTETTCDPKRETLAWNVDVK